MIYSRKFSLFPAYTWLVNFILQLSLPRYESASINLIAWHYTICVNLVIILTGPCPPIALKQELLWCLQIKPIKCVNQTSFKSLVVYNLRSPLNPSWLQMVKPSSIKQCKSVWPIRCFAIEQAIQVSEKACLAYWIACIASCKSTRRGKSV